jgi:hypothetical protein
MKKVLVSLHLFAILIILADNAILFQFLKNNSNYIKDKISSVEFLRNISSTVIRDLDYRKPEISENENCLGNEEMVQSIIDVIGEKRFQQQKLFIDHYRENGSILSNTIFLGDLVNEFMDTMIDTLFLPFVGSNEYCYNIMDTQWCQYQSINLFVFPISVRLFDYNPRLSTSQYRELKKSADVSICGKDGIVFNLVFGNKADSRQPYYLFVYENEAFVCTGDLIRSG